MHRRRNLSHNRLPAAACGPEFRDSQSNGRAEELRRRLYRSGPALTVPEPNLAPDERLPELIGNAACMLEISRRVRLVAPRMTPVLIEGPTGSGKELVAEALHRLSSRNRKPFVAINCAAIPEALLEAELFGHTRGAFTGAVQGRTGRIEAADGGTLFLDEIGEMPLGLQSKLLRFVECGELQRVGDNETVKVDVRIVAATHRPLAQQAQTGSFRPDLYYRLAVFLDSHAGAGRARAGSAAAGRSLSGEDGPGHAGEARGSGRVWRSSPRTTGRATSASWSMCWNAA